MTALLKYSLSLASFCLALLNVTGQPLPDRYRTEVFGSVTETSGVLYCEDVPQPRPNLFVLFLTGFRIDVDEVNTQNVDLFMDIFEPTGDTLSKRPAVVICFGGGFVDGERTFPSIRLLAQGLARMGFVTASIDYRLGMDITNPDLATRSVYRAVQDSRAAIRYLRENADSLRLDTSKIFIGGHSAGAFVALHNMYLDTEGERPVSTGPFMQEMNPIPDLGCLECTGIQSPASGKANGAFSLAGALGDTLWVQPGDEGAALFHSEDDGTVLYDTGMPFPDIGIANLPVAYGSLPISRRFTSLGAEYTFNSYTNRGHSVHEQSPTVLHADILPSIGQWFYSQYLKPDVSVMAGAATLCRDDAIQAYSFPSGDGVYFDWQVDGGTFLSHSTADSQVVVQWSDTISSGRISVTPYNCFRARGDSVGLSVEVVDNGSNNWTAPSGNWSVPSNWEQGRVPLPCDSVSVVNGGGPLTISTTGLDSIAVRALNLQGDIDLQLAPGTKVHVRE